MSALRIAAAILITITWAGLYTADAFLETFAAPAAVSVPMFAVVTWLFGPAVRRQIRNNGDGGDNGT